MKKQNGITLIALVITIIVLLILAGITIAMIAGQDSAPAKAVEARNANKVGEAKDAAALLITGYIQDYYNGKYVVNETAAKNAADVGAYINAKLATAVTKGEHTFQVVSGKLTVSDSNGTAIVTGTINSNGTITWNGEATSSGNSGNNNGTTPTTPTEPEEPTVLNSKPASASAAVTALSNEENTTIEDTLGNEIIVPLGFGIAYDSGENVEDGIVIEDTTNGNQFVWIPVGDGIKVSTSVDSSGTIDIELSRYTFDTTTGAPEKHGDNSIVDVRDPGYSFTDETTANITAFKTSVNSKGGYYIARYEAGIEGITDNNSLDTKTAVDGSVKPISKSGVGVWNYINRTNALSVSQGMYNNINEYRSDLINSYAWDTALVFMEKCGDNSNYANQIALQTELTTTGMATDGNKKDVQCNVYDMAGNVLEYATERYNYYNWPYANRGGYYGWNYCRASYRGGSSDYASEGTGFRTILYIL